MEKFFGKATSFTYFSGAVIGAVSMLAMPFTYGGPFWEVNILVTGVGILLVALTAGISAIALLSKNFPVQLSLVIGTVLVVSIAGQLEGPNPMLTLLQQIALVLLVLFLVSRVLVEALEAKKHAH